MPTRTPRTAIVVSEVEQVHRETKQALGEERSFWTDCILSLINEQTEGDELRRVVEVADELTALRRERYPSQLCLNPSDEEE